MAENAFLTTYNGQEVQQSDLYQFASTGGLADDHVLAELLRLAPYTGSNVAKAILPYKTGGANGGASVNPIGTVSSSGSANATIYVNPFRAVVGSRNTVSGTPTGPPTGLTTDSPALANWRDIRSGVFVGTVGTTLYQAIVINANASGNPRWDLVYASITPDSAGPSVNRRVKDPTSGGITTNAVPAYLYQSVTVTVVQGTPGATPAFPALPGDSAGVYNIPLAYVRVVNGFTSSHTILTQDIRATTNNGVMAFKKIGDGITAFPCNGNNDANTAFNTAANGQNYYNPNNGGTRPGTWLPPDWCGGVVRIAQIDNHNASSAQWSHQNLGIVDSSIDWRNRLFKTTGSYSTNQFATNPGLSSGNQVSPLYLDTVSTLVGNSFIDDDNFDTPYATVWSYASGGGVFTSLLVNMSNGNLCWGITGLPTLRFFLWIEATAQMTNY